MWKRISSLARFTKKWIQHKTQEKKLRKILKEIL